MNSFSSHTLEDASWFSGCLVSRIFQGPLLNAWVTCTKVGVSVEGTTTLNLHFPDPQWGGVSVRRMDCVFPLQKMPVHSFASYGFSGVPYPFLFISLLAFVLRVLSTVTDTSCVLTFSVWCPLLNKYS